MNPVRPQRQYPRLLLARCIILVLLAASAGPSLAATVDCNGTDPVPGTKVQYASGWGIDHRNTRYQPKSSIDSSNAGNLALKWVYGLANTTPRSYPLVTEDTIFIGDSGRGLVALDRETGCQRWLHAHDGPMSSAIVAGQLGEQTILLYNDRIKGLYAVDARTGKQLWHTEITDEPAPWYSGTPLVVGTRIYLPLASLEVMLPLNPLYGCCTTSGGMAALDLQTGKKLWYLPTIEAEAEVTGSHFWFVQEYGPSGAPVWGAPSYDAQRDLVFFGTGQNYSHPTTDTSDAIFAVQASTGTRVWVRQYTANDAYNATCNNIELNHPNCPKPTGPDVDFGAPTMLVQTPSGTDLLIAGQKSAATHALHPSTGEPAWTTTLGRGGIIGGVHWGIAANEALGLIFVPISDKEIVGFPAPGEPQPGLYALDMDSGKQRWQYTRQSRCDEQQCVFGLSSAIIAANDIVVTGSMDGYLDVVAADSGKLLWSHDAWRDYQSVNDVATSGGAFDAHGPMLADDLLLVTSGYGYVGRQRGGNALLVFQVGTTDE